ncbi:hypothetical protein [Marinibactrum halimedae]|uniref:Uncharacterized protein n=1 Tax=Marinibactrum halimedae TaxID=1444977 RepID=A0AA37WMV6_9GAMM|nr:hypothetical protein [Marinibactrum halimedae]MCD9457398.1 hypothetical protein [Marinibactrum halimedae]GLS25551.1 hypothetical protein GCM10007877_12650 [Marinibactrum halimedae]
MKSLMRNFIKSPILRWFFLSVIIAGFLVGKFYFHQQVHQQEDAVNSLSRNENFSSFVARLDNIEDQLFEIHQEWASLKHNQSDLLKSERESRERIAALTKQFQELEAGVLRVHHGVTTNARIVHHDLNNNARNVDDTNVDNTLISSNEVALEQRLDLFEARYQSQASNPLKELQFVDDITEGFQQLDLNDAVLETATCQGNMCRLVVAYQDEESMDELLGGDQPLVRWPYRTQVVSTQGGSTPFKSIVFISHNDE